MTSEVYHSRTARLCSRRTSLEAGGKARQLNTSEEIRNCKGAALLQWMSANPWPSVAATCVPGTWNLVYKTILNFADDWFATLAILSGLHISASGYSFVTTVSDIRHVTRTKTTLDIVLGRFSHNRQKMDMYSYVKSQNQCCLKTARKGIRSALLHQLVRMFRIWPLSERHSKWKMYGMS